MKVFALLMMLTITQVFAAGVYSQNTRISLNLNRTTVADVLNEIENKTEFNFFYNNKLIDIDREVDVKVENKDIYSILDLLFENTDVDYVVKNKHIILSNQLSDNKSQVSQQLKVKGHVVDGQSTPIVGVTVVVKGTTNGTVTNIDGDYTLSGVTETSILQFSFVGMKTVEKNVGSNTVIDVVMLEDAIGLQEVVAIGYGSMKKSDLTGAVIRANVEDFRSSPNTNLGQVLQGTVPGLNIGQVTSAGGTPSIQIRGKNTINGSTSVLIVLDGIIYNSSLSSINPNDIESIDVLKDASATAVYGAQAANGVILITTKKGTSGKTDISFSSSYTVQNTTKNLRPMNREEYLSFVREFFYDKAYTGADYTTPVANFDLASFLPDEVMRDAVQSDDISANDYDWWSEGTRKGSILENKLSISGGNNAASYLLSFGNTKQENFILNDDFNRNSIRINLDAHPTEWWKLGVQSFGSFINQDGAEPNIWALRTQSPLITPYDEKGNIKPYPFNTLDTNPFMGSDVADYERHNYFFANVYSEVKLPIEGLTYRFNLGNNYRVDQHYFASEYGAGLTGYASKQHATYSDYTFDNIINYARNFGIHDLSATFVYGAINRRYDYTDSNADGFSRITLGYNSLELGTNQFANSDAWGESLLYQMLRANYKLKNRYLITATLRRDGFSGFAENNKSALFPSLALGWVLSDETFMNVKWLNYLKLRGGYGISGNQTSRYKSLAKIDTQAGYVFGDGGSTLMSQKLASMQNSNLKWEKTNGLNAGFDFGFLKNRLNGSFEVYQTTTNDLLYDVAIPTITGFSSISSNVGEIQNRGIEFEISSRNFERKNFEWSTTFNISSNSNKVKTLLGTDGDGDGNEDDLISSNLFINEPISSIYGYIIEGIYQVEDEIPAGYNPGNYKIKDVTGEGDITTADRVILGKTDPAFSFGIMNKFRVHNFSLNFFINSIQGGKNGYLGPNSMALYRNDNNLRWNLISEQAVDLWSPNNRDATYARSITAGAIVPTRYEDRSFIRLQDVSISYILPAKLLKPYGIKDLGLFINGKNLLTLTNWKGWDPEANSNYEGRPVMKSFSIGLNITL